MLRDKSLVPLSRQHQHALALCVRLDRAIQSGEIDPEPWQAESALIFEQEIAVHFAAEEKEVFPAAATFPELRPVVQELIAEHALLRDMFGRAQTRTLETKDLSALALALSQHIRKEERQLFEGMQRVMSAVELATIGAALDVVLKDAAQACILRSDATRLRAKP
jgi:hemerythrin-like domain-containing protein